MRGVRWGKQGWGMGGGRMAYACEESELVHVDLRVR